MYGIWAHFGYHRHGKVYNSIPTYSADLIAMFHNIYIFTYTMQAKSSRHLEDKLPIKNTYMHRTCVESPCYLAQFIVSKCNKTLLYGFDHCATFYLHVLIAMHSSVALSSVFYRNGKIPHLWQLFHFKQWKHWIIVLTFL